MQLNSLQRETLFMHTYGQVPESDTLSSIASRFEGVRPSHMNLFYLM
jgi:hypothetical protein